MPIYEYICSGCSHEFEELVRSIEVADQVACPRCQNHRTQRKASVFAARSAAATLPRAGGCGRCGDPEGPCARE